MLHATTTASYFLPAYQACPICGASQLKELLRVGDRFQAKPGEFVLQRCQSCAHVFQNPPLNDAGLQFYYQDFYDGAGRASLGRQFAARVRLDQQRAKVVPQGLSLRRWLDVGAGHGHFCRQAQKIWPGVHFDALDQNSALPQAQQKGWVDRAISHSLLQWSALVFEQLAGHNAEPYDVVSMFHYLEHTREPRTELQAVSRVLRPGGYLIIENPDPESLLASLLGSYWLSWLQPQHLQLLSVSNLQRLLGEQDFTVVRVQRGAAHRPEDLAAALRFALAELGARLNHGQRVSPGQSLPVAALALGLGALPLLKGAELADHALAPLLRRFGASNTFRVVAQKNRDAV